MKVPTRRHAIREAPSRASSSISTRYSPGGCGVLKPASMNAALKRTTVGVVRVVTCGFPRKRALRLPLQFQTNRRNNVRYCQYIRGQRRHHFRVRTKRPAAPGAAQCIRYRKFGGGWRGFTMRKPPRPNQRVLYMHINCASSKAVSSFYFSRLNKNPRPALEKINGNSTHSRLYFSTLAIITPDFFRVQPLILALLSIVRQAVYKDRRRRPCRHRKKQPLKSAHSTAAPSSAPRGRFHA